MKRIHIVIISLIVIFLTGVLIYEFNIADNYYVVGKINFLEALIYMTILLVTYSICGYNLCNIIKIKCAYPLCTILGIVELIFLGLLFIFISEYKLLTSLFILLNISYYLYRHYRGGCNLPILDEYKIIQLIIYGFIFIHFSVRAYEIGISPPGDLISHNFLSNLFLFNDGIPDNYLPLSIISFKSIFINTGYSILCSLTSIVINKSPIYTSVLIGSTISTLMISLLYYTLDRYLNNKLYVILSVISLFLIPGGKIIAPISGNDLLMGNLINGTYPQHLGNLIFIFIISYSLIIQDNDKKIINDMIIYFVSVILIVISLRFMFYIMVYMLLYLYFNHFKHIKIKYIATLLFFLFLSFYIFKDIFVSSFDISFVIQQITFDYLLDRITFTFVSIIFLCLFLYLLIVKYKMSYIECYIFSFIIFNFIPLNSLIYNNILWMTTPKRFLLLSLPLVLICTAYIINKHGSKYYAIKKLYLIGIIILIMYNYTGILYSVNYNTSYWNKPVGNDYEAINYLVQNVDYNSLVLNDPNIMGLCINSFRLQNVVYDRSLLSKKNYENQYFLNRASECIDIIKNPGDYDCSYKILKKYNVRYIIISSLNKSLDNALMSHIKKTNMRYESYLSIYDENPNLRLLHKTKDTRVYEVLY